jgi:uncharacterized protein YmfQ (DUF2313 family)
MTDNPYGYQPPYGHQRPLRQNPNQFWVRKKFLPPQIRDRYVRRGCPEYGEAMLKLLPQGQAWPREEGSTLVRVCRALACYWGWVDNRAGDLLERESDPRITFELLPDWERAWGLPDPCFPEALTIGERQRMLILKMTWMGSQSRAYFERVMKWIGFDVNIKEFAPFMAGISECGDTRPRAYTRFTWSPDQHGDDNDPELFLDRPVPSGWVPSAGNVDRVEDEDNFRWYVGPPEMRFAWSARSDRMGLVWFRAGSGQAGVDPHLQFRQPQELQCLLNRWKPAHTTIVMDVGNLAFGSTMDGTFEPPTTDASVIRWRRDALEQWQRHLYMQELLATEEGAILVTEKGQAIQVGL